MVRPIRGLRRNEIRQILLSSPDNSFPVPSDNRQTMERNLQLRKNRRSIRGPRKKASLLLGQWATWHDAETRPIAKGLANAQDRSFAFPNCVIPDDLMRIIDWETWGSPLARVAFLSYLFSLGVPSGTLRLCRASESGPLLKFIPQRQKAMIGIRRMGDTEIMVIEFRFRKNLRGGCILSHPCLCAETHERTRDICHIRTFWPLVVKSCAINKPLFATMRANSANQQLKAVMIKLNYDQGHRFSPHAFRMGGNRRD